MSFESDILSRKDKDHLTSLNRKNNYGLSPQMLYRLTSEHKKARESGDRHKMEAIEYRLTDINFHYEVGLLHQGKYNEILISLKNF